MFAGSLQGVTQTLSLAVYQEFDVDFDNALAIGALLVLVSALVLFAAKAIPAWRRSARPRSRSPRLPPRGSARGRRRRPSRSSGRRAPGSRACSARSPGSSGRSRAASPSATRPGSTRNAASTCRRSGGSVGLVFQEYALFPHLDVRRQRRVRRGATAASCRGLLERLRIGHLARARPADISGGERQRVALARALRASPGRAPPRRAAVRSRRPHTRDRPRGAPRDARDLGLPTLLVTHDFDDAATLADRVGVLVDGEILQLGRRDELVAAPSDAFVASFTGANLLRGSHGPARRPDEVALDSGGSVSTPSRARARRGRGVPVGGLALPRGAGRLAQNHVRAPIASLVPLGNRVRVRIGPITAEVTAQSVERLGLREGEIVVASFKATGARLLPIA